MLLISLVASFSMCGVSNGELAKYRQAVKQSGRPFKDSGIIFLISDNGCIGCNNTVVNLAACYIERIDVFILTNASPAVINLSPLGDFAKYQTELKLDQTQILFFRNDSIVKRYHIDPENMRSELEKVGSEIQDFP